MKKILAIALFAFVVAISVGCGGGTTAATTPPKASGGSGTGR